MYTRAIAARLLAIAVSLVASAPAYAARTDIIVLKNGDRITGEVVQMKQGQLQVKTDDAGTLSIKWEKVASLATAAQYDLTLRDSRRFFGRLTPGTANAVDIVAEDGTVTTVQTDEVVWFAQIKNLFWHRLDGSMDLGGSYTHSSGVADLAFDLDVQYRLPSYRYSASFSTNVTRQDQEADETTSRYSLDLNYTKFVRNQWFVAPFALFEGNRELGFTFRGTGALSVGRYILQSNRAEVMLAGGAAAGRENPIDAASVLNVDALAAFDFSLFTYSYPTTRVDFGVLVFPSLDDPGRVRVNGQTKLKRELFHDFYVSLSGYDSYDNRPKAQIARTNDFGGSLSFGWTF